MCGGTTKMNILVTGGRGFIGSHFVELAIDLGYNVIDYDSLTYASNLSLPVDEAYPQYKFEERDIQHLTHIPPNIDWIVNFAAESHVDNSITSPDLFIKSNVLGVYNILNLIRGRVYHQPKLLHVSTDEVYGDFQDTPFTEKDVLTPSNPYSASKAAAEMLIMAYGRTYDIEYIITRSTNNYGLRQYPEKLIPNCVESIRHGKKIPIHGDGSYVRDWIRVEDNAAGIMTAMNHGTIGEIYNIGANNPMSNLQIVQEVVKWFGLEYDEETYIEFVKDRMGQDKRYAINSNKIRDLGWKTQFKKGLHDYLTIDE